MVLFFPAGFLRILKSGGIACHTFNVFSPMYDNENKFLFSENSAASNESCQRQDEWARDEKLDGLIVQNTQRLREVFLCRQQ